MKIADREDWNTVNKYLSDDLASDTDDEKRIAKAIKASNIEKDKRIKLRQRRKPYNVTSERSRPSSSYQNERYNKPSFSKPAKVCWECGRQGHFAADCIFKAPKGPNV